MADASTGKPEPPDRAAAESSSRASGDGLSPILVTVLFGLLAGFVELGDVAWRKFVSDELVWRNWQALWLTPLSYVVVCLPAALALWLGSRLLPKVVTPARTTWLAAFVPVFFAIWTFYPRINKLAVFVLALGIATQATRMLLARPPAVRRRVLRLGLTTAAVLACGGLLGNIGGRVRERGAIGNLPAAPQDAPNVLLLILDTVRGASTSLLGYGRETTPRIAALARGGANFRSAWSVSPWTLPSHVAMLSGRYPHGTDADWRHAFTDPYPTLAGVLRERGYATAGFVANVAYCSRETGLGRGFLHYEDYQPGIPELLMLSSAGRFFLTNTRLRDLAGFHDIVGRKWAPDINHAFLDWLPRRGGRPFFAFLNYYDAHEPYLPPSPWDTLFGPAGPRRFRGSQQRMRLAFPGNRAGMSPAEQASEQRAYDASIAYLDSELGKLFDELRTRNLLDNTIVVVTSDHGEQFGEHGLFDHGNSLYAQNTLVPLVIVYPPRVPAGRVVDDPVTLADLPATVLSLAGFGGDAGLPGRSVLDGSIPGVLGEVHPLAHSAPLPKLRGLLRSLVTDSLHWLANADGSEELYRWHADPAETLDLTGPDNAALRVALRARLDSLIGSRGPVRPVRPAR